MKFEFDLKFGALRYVFAVTGLFIFMACDPPRAPFDHETAASASPSNSDANLASRVEALKPPVTGDVLFVGGVTKGNASTSSAEFFDPSTKKFNSTGPIMDARAGHYAALLNNGDVAIGGGAAGKTTFTKKTVSATITDSSVNLFETYNPTNGTFTNGGVNDATSRSGATATTLVSGKVLIAGGADSVAGPTNTAEIFDPANGMTTPVTNNMTDARVFHTATLLPSGKVVLIGGVRDATGNLSSSADLYDPGTNSFTQTSRSPFSSHAGGAAVVLTTGPDSGKVLVVGGLFGGSSGLNAVSSAELYDPTGDSFSFTTSMNDSRFMATATVLSDGMVLAVGGFTNFFSTENGGADTLNSLFGSVLLSAELYDPVAATWTCIGGTSHSGGLICSAAMKMGRAAHTATLFTSGPLNNQVLVAGGLGASKPNKTSTELNEAELFDESSMTFTKISSMKKAHAFGTATLLN